MGTGAGYGVGDFILFFKYALVVVLEIICRVGRRR